MNQPVALVRAVVADPTRRPRWSLGTVPAPAAGPGRAVIAVRHASLNRGDLRYASLVEPGTPLGWDAAGTVVAAATDGTGPAEGASVVAFGAGAWAEQVAVPVTDMAGVPDGIDLRAVAGLPLAGVAALRALRRGGPTLGRRILVTGASGGVGRIAVQLAALGGAEVIASVGTSARGAGLTELGAARVVVGLDGVRPPIDVVVDTVGGAQLAEAYALLAPGGSVQLVGWSSGEPAVLEPDSTFGSGAAIVGTPAAGEPFGQDLALLVGWVAGGRLRIPIGWHGDWVNIDQAAAALTERRVDGKAILDISPAPAG